MFQPLERNLAIAICRKPLGTSFSFTHPPLPLGSLLTGGTSSASSLLPPSHGHGPNAEAGAAACSCRQPYPGRSLAIRHSRAQTHPGASLLSPHSPCWPEMQRPAMRQGSAMVAGDARAIGPPNRWLGSTTIAPWASPNLSHASRRPELTARWRRPMATARPWQQCAFRPSKIWSKR
jgi:hypothetical protein